MSDLPLEPVTVARAAELLGVSESAIRMRMARGTLSAAVGEDGLQRVTLSPAGRRNKRRHITHNITPHITDNITQQVTDDITIPDSAVELEKLRLTVTFLEKEQATLSDRLQEVQQDRDAWRDAFRKEQEGARETRVLALQYAPAGMKKELAARYGIPEEEIPKAPFPWAWVILGVVFLLMVAGGVALFFLR